MGPQPAPCVCVGGLRNRRNWNRRHAADVRCAGWKRRSWDKASVTLLRRRTIGVGCRITGHASTRKLVTVGVRSCESVRECLQERNDLVLLLIGQAEIAGGHIYIVPNLGHRPAVYLFSRSCWTVSGCDGVRIRCVTRIVEMYELLQALDVAIVKEPPSGSKAGPCRPRW